MNYIVSTQNKQTHRKILLTLSLSWLICLLFAQTQVGQDIDGEAAGDQSGNSVSMSSDGSRVAIGTSRNNGNGFGSGHVRVYELNGGSWTQLGQDIDGEAADDESGFSVSMSSDGSIVAIGATGNDENGTNSGHVRVYELNGGNWTQLGQDIDGEAANDESGNSVSMSSDGSIVAIGATGNDNGNGFGSGHVRVYQLSGGSWTQLGQDIDGEAAFDQSGYSVSMSSDGSRVAIGAIANGGNGSLSGHVRVYQLSGGSWTQLGQDIDGEAANDNSGRSVSMSSDGSIVAIGANRNDGIGNDSGHVRVYQLSGGSWTQLGQDIDGEAEFDNSGESVSVSSDGSRVAIGVRLNDENGTNSGHVRVYQLSGGSWTQLGQDIDGEAVGDFSGNSVSMSSDGSRVAISSTGNDGNGTNSGHVRVYNGFSSLPVELTLFEAKIVSQATRLKWQTASEINNEGFEIERSPDGKNWQNLGFINGNGTTQSEQSYQFTDEHPLNGRNYYRLKQMDFDGKFEYSDIESVTFKSNGNTPVQIFPNPVKKGTLTVQLDSYDEEEIFIHVYDMTGKTWLQQASFDSQTALNVQDLAAGIYVIAIAANGQIVRQKVVIE